MLSSRRSAERTLAFVLCAGGATWDLGEDRVGCSCAMRYPLGEDATRQARDFLASGIRVH